MFSYLLSSTRFVFEDARLRVYVDGSGQPWFNTVDVCKIVGYFADPGVFSSLNADQACPHFVFGRKTPVHTVTLTALFRLLPYARNKETAQRFRSWVRSVLLPAMPDAGRVPAKPHLTLDFIPQGVAQ